LSHSFIRLFIIITCYLAVNKVEYIIYIGAGDGRETNLPRVVSSFNRVSWSFIHSFIHSFIRSLL